MMISLLLTTDDDDDAEDVSDKGFEAAAAIEEVMLDVGPFWKLQLLKLASDVFVGITVRVSLLLLDCCCFDEEVERLFEPCNRGVFDWDKVKWLTWTTPRRSLPPEIEFLKGVKQWDP
jgi:hypothetical protein